MRGVPLGSHAVVVKDKDRSAKNEIVAPRIYNYQRPGSGWDQGSIDSPEKGRAYVRWAAANGIDGLKLGAERPEIMAALLDEAKKNGLGSTAHLQQGGVAQMYTIKDGIVYDAKQLLADVATMVEKQKRSRVSKTSSQ